MAKRLIKDRIQTGTENKRRFDDKAVSIDDKMEKAFDFVNMDRKSRAKQSLRNFIDEYMINFVLETKPSELTYKAIDEIENALKNNRPVQIQFQRGAGKTTLASIAILYLLSYGFRKFAVIISQNARSATNILKDIWRIIIEESYYSTDFPEICYPFQLCNGCYRRRQLYKGESTGIQKTATNIIFPILKDDNGDFLCTAGGAITVRGIGSGIRGLKYPAPTNRPDCVLLDDLLDEKAAINEETNQKYMDIINKDIFNLSSGKKLGVLMTSTPLKPDDITQIISNNKNWKTIKYPAILKYPDDIIKNPEKGLWAQYFQIYDEENINDKPHDDSLSFYRRNFKAMNNGSVLFQPDRFKLEDGHISGLQALLEKKHIIGDDAFNTEMQLQPAKLQYTIEIKPQNILKNQIDIIKNEIPDGFQFIIASSDLNLSFYISTTIIGFKADGTAHILNHIFKKCHVSGCVANAKYNKEVYDLLTQHGKELKDLNLNIKGWAIDANGVPFDIVTQFCNNSLFLTGIQACGFIGKASNMWNSNIRSKLRNDIDRTILCGDSQEQLKGGSGKRWVLWDSDYYREKVQNGFLLNVGLAGSISLYKGSNSEHIEYAQQICNEKLKFKTQKADGRTYYYWKSYNDHDMLDSTAQGFACASQFGISANNFDKQKDKLNVIKKFNFRKKIRFN